MARAANSPLAPGEHSIDRVTPRQQADGTYRLDWRIALPDGRTVAKITKAATIGAARRKAKQTAADLLANGGFGGQWKGTSSLSDYIQKVANPAIESAGLSDNSRARYRLVLRLLVGDCSADHRHRNSLKGHTIASGSRFRAMEACLQEIAQLHGSETARQSRTVLGKYIIQQLIRDEAITGNPLAGMSVDLRSSKPKPAGPQGGLALSRADWERVIDHLLALDPTEGLSMRQGRWSATERVAKRQGAIDLTLLQAATGLRISEGLALVPRHLTVDDAGLMRVQVEDSKTARPRTVPVLHSGVQERLIARQNAVGARGRLFGAPSDSRRAWDRDNAQKATTALYLQLQEELKIPAFKTERSHVWRATLNSLLIDVPEVVRAAFFGHDPAVNRSAYTDLTDVRPMVDAAHRLRAV
ncbi:hypothetical protein [Demequina sp.]|uniref:hypothetical protein n=1 Tax=Demequina sp. TaxID=2050685 RepID=UPI003A86183F